VLGAAVLYLASSSWLAQRRRRGMCAEQKLWLINRRKHKSFNLTVLLVHVYRALANNASNTAYSLRADAAPALLELGCASRCSGRSAKDSRMRHLLQVLRLIHRQAAAGHRLLLPLSFCLGAIGPGVSRVAYTATGRCVAVRNRESHRRAPCVTETPLVLSCRLRLSRACLGKW
jgi:hypothetical protein